MGTNDAKPITNRNNTTKTGAPSKYSAALGHKTKGSAIRWRDVDGPTIKGVIDAVTSVGDAITFGRTTDGGALSVTVLSGSERLKDYASNADDMVDLLTRIMETAHS